MNMEFWNTIDKLLEESEIVIDRQKELHLLVIPTLFIELIMDT